MDQPQSQPPGEKEGGRPMALTPPWSERYTQTQRAQKFRRAVAKGVGSGHEKERGYKKLPPARRFVADLQCHCSACLLWDRDWSGDGSALVARPRDFSKQPVRTRMRRSGGRRVAASAVLALAWWSWALAAAPAAAAQKYNAIFNFGDSITDTGNLCTNGKPSAITFTQPPYGETYFGTPTCRCSDGRVIPDFLSAKFGLPFLPPSKSTTADFKKGANMAITGATAMDAPFFRSLGLSDKIWNNGPISYQLQWFQQVTSAVCGSDCKSYLANSLFVFGEFGGNDYNAMLFGNYNADQASTYTPQIVSTIAAGVEKLVAMGATDIVVPGVLPIGCFPIYCTIYGTSNSADYDSLGCLKKFNDLSTNHNNQLQTQIASLQAKYKSARIMYADFYSAVYDMVKNPGSYGFSTAFQACCGSGGGKYNYQNSARCGMSGAYACSNPAAHLSWDGIHLTEAAYKQITDGWLNGPYCRPAILHS